MKLSIHPVVGKVISVFLNLAALSVLAYLLAEPACRMWHQLRPNEFVTSGYAFDYILGFLFGSYALLMVSEIIFRYLSGRRNNRILAKKWGVSEKRVEAAIKMGILADRDTHKLTAVQFQNLWVQAQSRQTGSQAR